YALSYLPFAQRDCTSSSQTRRLGCSVFVSTAAACTEIYTLSLHDALPIYIGNQRYHEADCDQREYGAKNSSHNVHPGGPFLEIPGAPLPWVLQSIDSGRKHVVTKVHPH